MFGLVLGFFLGMQAATVPGFAQGTGEAIEVRPSAQIITGGAARTLSVGGAVSGGDLIKTNRSGKVQMLFPDETKIVVGPSAQLRIDDTLFRKSGVARKFATTGLAGSIRFISGQQTDERVYKLATPLATMGIRGTAFDYTVTPDQKTDLLVFDGVVRFCAPDRRCALVPGGCQAVTLLRDGTFEQPLTLREKRELLLRSFPLLADQSDLRPPFRTSTAGCDTLKLIRLPANPGRGEPNPRSPSNNNGGGGGPDNPADGPSDPPGNNGNPAE